MPITVFISSTINDLGYVRDELYRRLTEDGYEPWVSGKPGFPEHDGLNTRETCLRNAEEADFYVLILHRDIGSGCTADEFRRRKDRKPKGIFLFIHSDTWHDWGYWQKLSEEQRGNREWRTPPGLLRFLEEVMGRSGNQQWANRFDGADDVMRHLTTQLPPPADDFAAHPEETLQATRSTEESSSPSPTSEGGQRGRAAKEAMAAWHLARSADPERVAVRLAAASMLLGGCPSGFWFLRGMASVEWVRAITPPLRKIAGDPDGNLLWALGRALAMIAPDDPDLVAKSSLIETLWDNPSPQGLPAALDAIEAGELWEHERIVELLSRVQQLGLRGVQAIAYRLSQYGQQSEGAAGFALELLAKWIALDLDEAATARYVPLVRPLGTSLREVMDAQRQAALPHVEALLDAGSAIESETYVLMRLRQPLPSPTDDENPVIQVSHLLSSQLTEPHSREEVIFILEDLIADENVVNRVVAMDVAKHDVDACKGIILQAIRDPRNQEWPQSAWVTYLIPEVFPSLSEPEREDTVAALLALPDEDPDKERKGARKYYTLAAIPSGYATSEVNDALDALRSASPGLPDTPPAPERPGQPTQWHVGVEEVPLDFPRLISEPAELVCSLRELAPSYFDETSPLTYSLDRALSRALEEDPDQILPVARAVAEADPPLPASISAAAAWAVREAETFSGQVAYEVATMLESVSTSEGRRHLAQAIAENWETVEAEAQTDAIELLSHWTAPECEPDPVPEADEEWLRQNPDREAADHGLNSTRGSVGTALVDIVKQAEGEACDLALRTIETLSRDPAPSVRAIVLLWIGNIAADVGREWAFGVLQNCVADLHPRVLPYTRHLLRFLSEEEVVEFGVSLARVMVYSGGEAAKVGGPLAALWKLQYPSCEPVAELLDEVMNGQSLEALSEAARVFGYNLIDTDEETRAICREKCQELLSASQPKEVRASVIHGLPRGDEVDLTPANEIIESAATDEDQAAFDGLGSLFHRAVRGEADIVTIAAVLSGILDNPSEEAQAAFLHANSYRLVAVYRLLKANGQRNLADRLLDRCCYHCIAAVEELLEDDDDE